MEVQANQMIIAIDLTSLSWHLTGIERYAMCVADKMLNLDMENTYILIFRNEIPPLFADRIDGKHIKAQVLRGENKFVFLQLTLAGALRKIKADKYLFFAFPGPMLFRRKGIINTIHDMGAWDSAEEMKLLSKYYFRISYRFAARVSEKIITVSEFSKKRIEDILGIPESKISVISSAVYDRIMQSKTVPFNEINNIYDLPQRYILTLSTLEPRKNMRILIEAYNNIADKVNYDLVLAGRKGWKIDDLLNKYGAKKRIHITGFIEDEHLAAVYKNAMCFVFPSKYEGFGLPPIEALSLGVPVISSDAAALPEVLMDSAIYFRSNSQEELETVLSELEQRIETMPHKLNDYQKHNYTFTAAGEKVLALIKDK